MFTKVKNTSIKAFSILLAIVMCFTAFSVCVPVVADAAINANNFYYGRYYYYPANTKFISSFAINGSSSNADDAKNWFKNNGYTYLETDLNSGAGGNWIYIGYKTTTDINQAAATYIRVKHEGEALNPATAPFTVNGKEVTFTGITNGEYVYDVNQGADKTDYTYVYYSNDPSLGLPITAITVTGTANSSIYYLTAEADNSGKPSDLNSKNDNKNQGGEDSDNDILYLNFGNYDVYTNVSSQMDALMEAINTANSLGDSTCYTTASWNTFKAALDTANNIKSAYTNKYNAASIPGSEITAATTALKNAMSKLETIIRIDAVTNGGTTSSTYFTTVSGSATTIKFPASTYTATKEGHTFLGWNTDKDATFGSKTQLTVPVGATVYAIFLADTYNVSFYNSVTKETIKTESVEHGKDATAPAVSQIIKNNDATHFVFKGWNKTFTNIKESVTISTIYEEVAHSYELTSSVAPTCNKEGTNIYTCKDCNHTKTETLPKVPGTHTNTISYPQKDSTCTVAGYTEYVYCNDCKTVISGKEPLPLAEHKWGDWSTPTATCTTNGTSTRTCSACGKTETKTVEATGHSWSDWTTTKEATCTTNGRKQRQCSVCKETETEIINALGHDHVGVVTEPTCTEKGFTTFTCSRCKDSYIDKYVDALDHNWENVGDPTIEATCETEGEQNQKCSRCPATRVATIEKLGHDWQNQTIIKEASCTEDGLMSATCNRCGFHDAEIKIVAFGHSYDEGVITIAPTCTEPGNRRFTCGTCGHTKNVEEKALGHDWDEGTVKTVATCTQEGKVYYECNRCDASKTETKQKLPHNYKGVVTFPTCTEDGYTTYTCADCGNVIIDDAVEALGHATITTIVPPTCTLQGYTVTRCLVCNKIERDNYVPATGHIYEETVVSPTCTKDGYTLATCTTCSNSFQKDPTKALGHELVDSTIAPTCTQKGYDLHACIRGDYEKKDNYVDATGHDFVEDEDARVDPTKTHSGYALYICNVCSSEKKEILYYNGKALICETLYDTNGNPVAEATVEIYSMTTGKYYVIKTDLNGYFTELLEEGDYEIVIKKIGYKDTKGYIYVNDNKKLVEIPAIPVIEESECDCFCHKTDIISTIRRIFAKILKLFGTAHNCCEYSEV